MEPYYLPTNLQKEYYSLVKSRIESSKTNYILLICLIMQIITPGFVSLYSGSFAAMMFFYAADHLLGYHFCLKHRIKICMFYGKKFAQRQHGYAALIWSGFIFPFWLLLNKDITQGILFVFHAEHKSSIYPCLVVIFIILFFIIYWICVRYVEKKAKNEYTPRINFGCGNVNDWDEYAPE